jgi:signal transduction histidine kinase
MDYTTTLTRIAELSVKSSGERASIEKIVSEAAGLFNSGVASIFRIGQDWSLGHLASSGVSPHSTRKLEEAGGDGWPSELFGDSLAPVVLQDAQKQTISAEVGIWARLLNASTIALVPLRHDKKVLGVLALFHRAPYTYSSEECDLLVTIAALTAAAVERTLAAEGGLPASLKSQLFSVLGHELRTPLTSIMGFTQLIRKRLASSSTADPRLIEQLDVLWAQAQRLNRLIDTFVDITRIERGEFEIAHGQVELTELLRLSGEQALAQASAHHMINLDIPNHPVWLHGDSKRLEQAFNHVISNAVRYSPQDAPITITCRQDSAQSTASIEIIDQGPGIPSARLKEIFDRNSPSGPLKSGGLGVGLYMSKVIVEAHGGQIAINSHYGKGTTVAISLPV